jgi:hypothetical protein
MSESKAPERTASDLISRLFDLRGIIALLFYIYGIVLVIVGLVGTSDEEIARAGGINLNLWSGAGMLIVAALFTIWLVLRPLKLPTPEELDRAPDPGRPAH